MTSPKVWSGRLAAAHQSWHERMYRRLGPRYPRADVASVIAFLPLVSMGATAVTALYISMSVETFFKLLGASLLLFGLVGAVTWSVALRQLRPLDHWLRSEDVGDARAAWRAAARLPWALPRARPILLSALVACVAWDLFAAYELSLGWPAALVFLAGSALAFLYWMMVTFLSLEHGLRPVLDDLSAQLPYQLAAAGAQIPLRLRLATSISAINIITGVVVAGVFPGQGGIRDLAIGIGAALLVSITVSLYLTNLLTESVAAPVSDLATAAGRVEDGDLDTRVSVASRDELGELTHEFNSMVSGLQKRERLREAFGAFVDPSLAEEVEKNSVDLDGQEVEATIVFVDVRGFTAMAERLEPRQMVSLLNELFDVVVPIVLEHGGHANKFVGDGLMAVFGAPQTRPDHAARAAQAALELSGAVRQAYGDELRVGVGVNSGTVIAGTLGGGGRLDFTVIGDAVNTAARVEAATRETGDDVLVTNATLNLLPADRHPGWVLRTQVPLKGKRQPVSLFAPRGNAEGSN